AEDVIEGAQVGSQVEDAGVFKCQVGKFEALDEMLSVGDLSSGEIHAQEGGSGERFGHRDEVAAGGATEFEDAGGLDGWRAQAEGRGDGRQSRRVRLRVRKALVRNLVVTGRRVRWL